MMASRRFLRLLPLAALLCGLFAFVPTDDRIARRVVDPKQEAISLHWKDRSGTILGNIGALEREVSAGGGRLSFAMNGGMYTADQGPVGLYIQEGKLLHAIDRRVEGKGNFHMQPNGVFGILNDGTAFVKTTGEMQDMREVRYATQSGPMLVTHGAINTHFTPGSKNLHIRNGVGVRTDGQVVFAISREPINFHDFASWFVEQGCSNALYLDGSVSKAYIPEAGLAAMDGNLGVLIAITALH